MTRTLSALGAALALAASAHAGPFGFGKGIGSGMEYGPYTGGHRYSYNVAYSYGHPFSAADAWRYDLLAYPAGVRPLNPYERPPLFRAYPVGPYGPTADGVVLLAPPAPATSLGPAAGTGLIRITAPEGAEVLIDKEPFSGGVYQTPPLNGRARLFAVRAKWRKDGDEVEQFRAVSVKPGETAAVAFTD